MSFITDREENVHELHFGNIDFNTTVPISNDEAYLYLEKIASQHNHGLAGNRKNE